MMVGEGDIDREKNKKTAKVPCPSSNACCSLTYRALNRPPECRTRMRTRPPSNVRPSGKGRRKGDFFVLLRLETSRTTRMALRERHLSGIHSTSFSRVVPNASGSNSHFWVFVYRARKSYLSYATAAHHYGTIINCRTCLTLFGEILPSPVDCRNVTMTFRTSNAESSPSLESTSFTLQKARRWDRSSVHAWFSRN
jgi:hypothetical protein